MQVAIGLTVRKSRGLLASNLLCNNQHVQKSSRAVTLLPAVRQCAGSFRTQGQLAIAWAILCDNANTGKLVGDHRN